MTKNNILFLSFSVFLLTSELHFQCLPHPMQILHKKTILSPIYWKAHRFLSLGRKKNPFLKAIPKVDAKLSKNAQSDAKDTPIIPPFPQNHTKPPMYATLHPQRFMDDDLLNDDATDSISGFTQPKQSKKEKDKLQKNETVETVNTDIQATLPKLLTCISQGDTESAVDIVQMLCRQVNESQKRSELSKDNKGDFQEKSSENAILPNKQSENEVSAAKSVEVEKLSETHSEKEPEVIPKLDPTHPLFRCIQCLPMHTFYCLPDDTACEKAFQLELSQKSKEWAHYREALTSTVHSAIVHWYASSPDKVSLIAPGEEEVLQALQKHREGAFRNNSDKRRSFFDRRRGVSKMTPKAATPFKRVSKADPNATDLEVNLVLKALRPEKLNTGEKADALRFSVGVRGDSFPQDLAAKLTKELNETDVLGKCPVSAAFDMYFSVVYDESREAE